MSTVPAPAPVQSPGKRATDGGKLLEFDGSRGDGPGVALPAGTVTMIGVWIALVPTLMLFLSLVSAYVVRRGLGGEWGGMALPRVLWLNTGILLLSSVAMEVARRHGERRQAARVWLWAGFLLGAGFLAGQILAWRQFLADGVGLGTAPFGSFFYLLSGVHAVHLGAGVIGLLAAAVWPATGWFRVSPRIATRAAAVYWHFLDVLWVGLFLLLVLWR